jgi:hypothetical protein
MDVDPRVTQRSVAAGGPTDFMTVVHLVLRGRQVDIGRALAEESAAHFMPPPVPVDPVVQKARRSWFERNWPQHHARMLGAAEARGVDPADAAHMLDLPAMPFSMGCSALWCPPPCTVDGRARIGRNFDFSTGSVLEMVGLDPDPTQPAMVSRPYLIETYPDDGHACLVVTAFDLSGCFEGINDAGLTVVLLADDETPGLRPTGGAPQAGVDELQLGRFLLDTCTSVEEAKAALYATKQYDRMVPCHYLIADAHGQAFVWERDTHNAEHVVDAGPVPLCVTNYLLHRYADVAALPADDDASRSGAVPFHLNKYQRARTLHRHAASAPLSTVGLTTALDEVRADDQIAGGRTLWRTLYDIDARLVEATFYLGDEADGSPRRSAPREFALSTAVS